MSSTGAARAVQRMRISVYKGIDINRYALLLILRKSNVYCPSRSLDPLINK